jgi:hypothetical protein
MPSLSQASSFYFFGEPFRVVYIMALGRLAGSLVSSSKLIICFDHSPSRHSFRLPSFNLQPCHTATLPLGLIVQAVREVLYNRLGFPHQSQSFIYHHQSSSLIQNHLPTSTHFHIHSHLHNKSKLPNQPTNSLLHNGIYYFHQPNHALWPWWLQWPGLIIRR